jgi:hypothetical protein
MLTLECVTHENNYCEFCLTDCGPASGCNPDDSCNPDTSCKPDGLEKD